MMYVGYKIILLKTMSFSKYYPSVDEKDISAVKGRQIKMGKHCIIPRCNPNHRSKVDGSIVGKKAAVFRFPTNEEECRAWLRSIPLKKTINVKTSVVCERHWPTSYATVSKKGKVRPRDPPSLWPEHPEILPPSYLPNPPPKPRPTKLASLVVRGMQPDEMTAPRYFSENIKF